MSISFKCDNPSCGKQVRAPDDTSGKKARCPSCGRIQIVPTPEADWMNLADLADGPPPADSERPRARPPMPGPRPGMSSSGRPMRKSGWTLSAKTVRIGAAIAALAVICVLIVLCLPDSQPPPAHRPGTPSGGLEVVDQQAPATQLARKPAPQPAAPRAEAQPAKPRTKKDRVVHDPFLGYGAALLGARKVGKGGAARGNFAALGTALLMYADERKGRFPPSLEDLVNDGYMPAKVLRSSGDPDEEVVYLPGFNRASDGETIVAYDPVEYRGKIVILRVNGTVSTLKSEAELERILVEQGSLLAGE